MMMMMMMMMMMYITYLYGGIRFINYGLILTYTALNMSGIQNIVIDRMLNGIYRK